MAEKDIHILGDQPTSDAKFFNFDAYAEALARIITHEETKTPLVVGIFGEWGSGKTSLMKTVEKKIRNITDNYPTIWFNAWKYDKEEAIWRALLTRILEELKTKGKNEKLDNELCNLQDSLYQEVYREEPGALTFDWGKATKGTLKVGIAMLPFIGDIAKLVEKATDKDAITELSEAIKREKNITSIRKVQFLEQFQTQFEGIIKKYYVNGNKRAVIFIDDLDRCVPEKAIEVLEAIKLFLDVEGCIFILGIDRRVVSQGVDIKYKDFMVGGRKIPISGDDYLEKIIQLSFMLPPIPEETLKKFISDFIPEEFYAQYLGMILKGVEPNPRKIKRFINAIEFQRNLANLIPEIKELVKPEIKESFNAFLIEWQLISSSSRLDYGEFRKFISDKPVRLLEIHRYLESEPKAEPPAYLSPFLKNESLKELIKAFPHKEALKSEDIEKVIGQVIYLSRVTGTTDVHKEVLEKKPMTREEVEDAIRKKMSLENADLLGADLKGLDMSGMRLRNLSYANLSRADLSGANLDGARLTGAVLQKANLSYAIIDAEATDADLSYADLSFARISSYDPVSCHFERANFSHANLSNADVDAVYFHGANFSYARFNNAKITSTVLSNADLSGADLSGASLIRVETGGVIVNEQTKAENVNLVAQEDSKDETKVKEALESISENLRKVILRDNEHLRNIYEASNQASGTSTSQSQVKS